MYDPNSGNRLSPAAVRRYLEARDDIKTLAKVQSFVELGREQALEKHLGRTPYNTLQADLALEQQRKRASRPRTDGLQRVILEIIQQDPNCKTPDVLKRLQGLVGSRIGGVTIEAVTDDAVEWRDDRSPAGVTLISALKDRVSRARQRLQESR